MSNENSEHAVLSNEGSAQSPAFQIVSAILLAVLGTTALYFELPGWGLILTAGLLTAITAVDYLKSRNNKKSEKASATQRIGGLS
ncbi:hypothetical protein [Pleionea litopenaei]|uniref:Uncharacterized protein n=1 Tax=Pleionea litopenaei TaxID=3070815 RepID=A0AA51RSK2_9GAMM|nr:hypothetical protein [Pleionea sp. HL-JVS1]WMS86792.1 hypothetical protein Q9312_16345 [Pleionea sp. HL-JVS1]